METSTVIIASKHGIPRTHEEPQTKARSSWVRAILRDDLFTLRSQFDRFTHDNERGPASLEAGLTSDPQFRPWTA